MSRCACPKNRPLNVVLFQFDDFGWTDLSCYGSRFSETPQVDKLAKEGVRFVQAYAACHVCSPTRASDLIGKHPARLQMTDWLPGRKNFPFQKLRNARILQHLPDEEITLANALRKHGYAQLTFSTRVRECTDLLTVSGVAELGMLYDLTGDHEAVLSELTARRSHHRGLRPI